MTTHHPKLSMHTALELIGLTSGKLLPTALMWYTNTVVSYTVVIAV